MFCFPHFKQGLIPQLCSNILFFCFGEAERHREKSPIADLPHQMSTKAGVGDGLEPELELQSRSPTGVRTQAIMTASLHGKLKSAGGAENQTKAP